MDLNREVTRFLADASQRTAIYVFCTDRRKDPVAGLVLDEVIRLYEPVGTGLSIDGTTVRVHSDAHGNRAFFVGTADLCAENWARYRGPLLETAAADVLGIVNWHEGANAPDRILCVHSSADVAAGIFGRADGGMTRAMTRALERNRQTCGLHDWSTLVEATHWAGTYVGGSAGDLADVRVPVIDIEIGSSPDSWRNPSAVRAVARSLFDALASPPDAVPQVVAVGGRHFEPVYSSAVLSDAGVAVAHQLPNYVLSPGYETDGIAKLRACLQSVAGGARQIVYHDSIKSAVKQAVRAVAEPLGLAVINHRQLRDAVNAAPRVIGESALVGQHRHEPV